MFHLPELVEHLMLSFDGQAMQRESSLAACTQVSRAWRQIFIPLYWRHIDDSPFTRLGITFRKLWFKDKGKYSNPQSREESLERRAYLGQFLHHVRQLDLRLPWTLDLFVEWSITQQQSTQLLVLTLDPAWFVLNLNWIPEASRIPQSGFRTGLFSRLESDQETTRIESMVTPDASSLHDGWLLPLEKDMFLLNISSIIAKPAIGYQDRERFGRAIWQLIQKSPKLTRLTFESQVTFEKMTLELRHAPDNAHGNDATEGVHPIEQSTDGMSFFLQKSPAAYFLNQIFSSHRNLTHFQPGLSDAEEVLLEVMAQRQRHGCLSIRSYTSVKSNFALPSDHVSWNLMRNRFLNTGVRRLSLGCRLTTASRVRFFIEIFPNLEELHMPAVGQSAVQKAEERDILVNTSLRKFSIQGKAHCLATFRVRFEALQEFEALQLGHEVWDLVPLLRMYMPQCKVFRVGVSDSWRHTERPPSSLPSSAETWAVTKGIELPVRELALRLKRFRPLPDIVDAIQDMPFLTQVEFGGNLGTEVLERLTWHCPKLQRLKVTKFRGRSSLAICLLLRSCKDLISIQGPDLVLRAVDVVKSQPWVCTGMQEFSCRILGVPRLTDQEEIYLEQSDMELDEVRRHEAAERAKWQEGGEEGEAIGREGRRDGAGGDDNEEHSSMQQRKKQIQQLCRRRKLLMLQQRSREIQHQVFSVLAKWTDLEVLDLGYFRPNYRGEWVRRRRPYTLEWSFDSGVQQLESLKKLRAVYIHKYEHRVSEGERQWMSDSWPRLRSGDLVERP
ncbi:integrator complex subunit 7 [Entomortierella parvispora]|uniref:Integrator complex subunit 7 n=1 Tax=Entomortierella parvispora TaxID=205924 RepID=A0A9P3LST8_9FUNG|nr:integrator complex subunit 7 [Entomortierella parvispora]